LCDYLNHFIIISCERLVNFTSIVIRIILCDIAECSLYLYSLFERLSASFHVYLFTTFDSGLVVADLRLWLDLILLLT